MARYRGSDGRERSPSESTDTRPDSPRHRFSCLIARGIPSTILVASQSPAPSDRTDSHTSRPTRNLLGTGTGRSLIDREPVSRTGVSARRRSAMDRHRAPAGPPADAVREDSEDSGPPGPVRGRMRDDFAVSFRETANPLHVEKLAGRHSLERGMRTCIILGARTATHIGAPQ